MALVNVYRKREFLQIPLVKFSYVTYVVFLNALLVVWILLKYVKFVYNAIKKVLNTTFYKLIETPRRPQCLFY